MLRQNQHSDEIIKGKSTKGNKKLLEAAWASGLLKHRRTILKMQVTQFIEAGARGELICQKKKRPGKKSTNVSSASNKE